MHFVVPFGLKGSQTLTAAGEQGRSRSPRVRGVRPAGRRNPETEISMKAIFGPNTPRVLQFLTRMRKLSPAEIDRVATSWNKVNPLDRALAWAHLQSATAAKEDYPVIAAASAAPRGHGNRPHAGPQRLGLLGRRLGRRRRHHRR